MTDDNVFELNLPGIHRHGQPGYYSLSELPQRQPIDEFSIGTGWWELDRLWRLYPGQFVIVTGTAGHGKSTFLLNVMCNVAKNHQVRSFLYVPENEGHLKQKIRGIWGSDPGFTQFCDEDCFIQSAIPEHYAQEARTLDWVLNKAVVAIKNDGCSLVLIDPWNEIERARPKDELMTDYIGRCLMWMKQFCRLHEVVVILVAHPTKAGIAQGHVPTLADIEGSMNWYNKCDNGLIVVREQGKNTAQVISAKVRENGAGKRGVCHFFVDEATGIFTPQLGAVT